MPMETIQNQRTPVRESDKNALVLRLERNQEDLLQLRTKLNSYRFEPRTYSLFEHIETLKHSMDRLSNKNQEIINALREHKKTVGDYVEGARQQFSEFQRLHAGVEEYLTNCLHH